MGIFNFFGGHDDYGACLAEAELYCKELNQIIESIRIEHNKNLGEYYIESDEDNFVDLEFFPDQFEIPDFLNMVKGYKAYLDSQ